LVSAGKGKRFVSSRGKLPQNLRKGMIWGRKKEYKAIWEEAVRSWDDGWNLLTGLRVKHRRLGEQAIVGRGGGRGTQKFSKG